MAGKVWEEAKPQVFSGGEDRVRFDPVSGESTVLFDAPEAFEQYAATLGLEPGTEEYFRAAEDFVLRANGPSALERDREIDDWRTSNRLEVEGVRQSNRLGLEGVRQRNRTTLRGTPSYRDLNPPAPRAPARRAGPARPTATGKNGEKYEYDGKAWVRVR